MLATAQKRAGPQGSAGAALAESWHWAQAFVPRDVGGSTARWPATRPDEGRPARSPLLRIRDLFRGKGLFCGAGSFHVKRRADAIAPPRRLPTGLGPFCDVRAGNSSRAVSDTARSAVQAPLSSAGSSYVRTAASPFHVKHLKQPQFATARRKLMLHQDYTVEAHDPSRPVRTVHQLHQGDAKMPELPSLPRTDSSVTTWSCVQPTSNPYIRAPSCAHLDRMISDQESPRRRRAASGAARTAYTTGWQCDSSGLPRAPHEVPQDKTVFHVKHEPGRRSSPEKPHAPPAALRRPVCRQSDAPRASPNRRPARPALARAEHSSGQLDTQSRARDAQPRLTSSADASR